jgi:hypothetical protein
MDNGLNYVDFPLYKLYSLGVIPGLSWFTSNLGMVDNVTVFSYSGNLHLSFIKAILDKVYEDD